MTPNRQPQTVKALSLWQPWASLIPLGAKTIETRHWPTNHRGPLAIHATKRCEPGPLGDFKIEKDNPRGTAPAFLLRGPIEWPYRLPLGAVVATCQLVDCVPIHLQGCGCRRAGLSVVRAWGGLGREVIGLFRSDGMGICGVNGTAEEHPYTAANPHRDMTEDLPYGGYDCGRWAWLLTDIRRCAIPAVGHQGLWDWTPPPSESAVSAALELVPTAANGPDPRG